MFLCTWLSYGRLAGCAVWYLDICSCKIWLFVSFAFQSLPVKLFKQMFSIFKSVSFPVWILLLVFLVELCWVSWQVFTAGFPGRVSLLFFSQGFSAGHTRRVVLLVILAVFYCWFSRQGSTARFLYL